MHTGSTVNMDKVDYRRQYRDQVISDASQASGKNWWCQRWETGTGRELFQAFRSIAGRADAGASIFGAV